jgi:F0F1-type ATP synthase assembly protein I
VVGGLLIGWLAGVWDMQRSALILCSLWCDVLVLVLGLSCDVMRVILIWLGLGTALLSVLASSSPEGKGDPSSKCCVV